MVFTNGASTDPAFVDLANLADVLITNRAGVGTLHADVPAAKGAFPRVNHARPALIRIRIQAANALVSVFRA